MFNVAWYLLMESCRTTEDEADAQERVQDKLKSLEIERETGMPQLPSWVPRADQFVQQQQRRR